MALKVGHLAYETKWNLKDCSILHQLTGDNFSVTHAVYYQSTNPEHLRLVKKAEAETKKKIW
jgi:hypothetical protein